MTWNLRLDKQVHIYIYMSYDLVDIIKSSSKLGSWAASTGPQSSGDHIPIVIPNKPLQAQ